MIVGHVERCRSTPASSAASLSGKRRSRLAQSAPAARVPWAAPSAAPEAADGRTPATRRAAAYTRAVTAPVAKNSTPPDDGRPAAIAGRRVSGWLVATMAGGIGGFFAVVGRALLLARNVPVATGPEALVGRTGVATSDLGPAGTVSVGAESWTAVAAVGRIARGERVRVLGVEGVRLRVVRAVPR